MHGLFLIDKPAGVTSHDVVRQMRRLCRTKKVGHAGTLDPLATGVLPVAVGQGTKILQFLLAENKSYRATLQFGVTTDTLDSEGEVIARDAIPDNLGQRLDDVIPDFVGSIQQVPPMYSAIKHNGVPLYKLARAGQTIEREPRSVTITRLQLLSVAAASATIEVDCSKGTYIRALINDIGAAIGCGAYMTALSRLQSGSFTLQECRSLNELSQCQDLTTMMLSPAQALRDRKSVILNDKSFESLKFGIPPRIDDVDIPERVDEGECVRLMRNEQLAAVAYFNPVGEQTRRGDFKLVRVFVSH